MIKFLHTADWHLGAKGHEPEIRDRILPSLFGLAEYHNVDFILAVGDIFDRPEPGQRVKDHLLKHLIKSPKPIIFTVGNHDYIDKAKSYHSLEYLKILEGKLKDVYVLETGVHILDSVEGNICFKVFSEDLEPLPEPDEECIFTIGCFHGILPGLNVKNLDIPQRVSIRALLGKLNVSYLALGDIHKRIGFSKKCFYPGTLYQKTFSDDAGAVVVSIEGKKVEPVAVDLGLPRKMNLHVEVDEECTEEGIVEYVKQNVKKGDSARLKFSLPQKIYTALDKEHVRSCLHGYVLKLKFDNEPIQEEKTKKDLKKMAKAKTPEEEIKVVIDAEKHSLNAKLLFDFCKRYIR